VRRNAPAIWALALAVLLLGPALGRGYLLTYDMVWVPDLALRGDFLGLGSALPRAVPSDAVVSVLDEVVPGMLLQKLVLLGALLAGAVGAARLAGPATVARLIAVSVYLWSPFVVERLWIGHWPVLLCWAVLPWLVLEGARVRRDARLGPLLPVLLLVGSLSANAGLMSAAALVGSALTSRTAPRLLALVAGANAPWIVAGLLHAGEATGAGAGVFALSAEGPLPAPVAALTLGGIWNSEVVPGSRETLILPVALTVILAAAAVTGLRPLADRLGRRTTIVLGGLWAAGYLLAVLTWAAPGLIDAIASTVPGGGLLRDGARFLALGAPATAALAGAGAARLADRASSPRSLTAPRVVVAVVGALTPLALMPDAAWGLSGTLRPATYPDDYAAARAVLAEELSSGASPGDLLVLPFSSFRAPSWNHGRTVLDPLPRYLQPDYLVDDRLWIAHADGVEAVAGEDPRGADVLAALALPEPESRSRALANLGIGLVARSLDAPSGPGQDAEIAGTILHAGPAVELVRLSPGPAPQEDPWGWRLALGLAWLGFACVLAPTGWNMLQRLRAENRRRLGTG